MRRTGYLLDHLIQRPRMETWRIGMNLLKNSLGIGSLMDPSVILPWDSTSSPNPAPLSSAPSMPPASSPSLDTPDFENGGWTYMGTPCHTKAKKNKAKKDWRWEQLVAQGLPLTGSSGVQPKAIVACITRNPQNKIGSESKHTDSVSESEEEPVSPVIAPPEEGQLSKLSMVELSPETPVSQVPSLTLPHHPPPPIR